MPRRKKYQRVEFRKKHVTKPRAGLVVRKRYNGSENDFEVIINTTLEIVAKGFDSEDDANSWIKENPLI